VSYGSTRVKVNGNKIRKLHDNVVCGFAGTLADCFTLMEGLETRIIKSNNRTLKACIDYAK
jgi:ATP-dependent HslUV protease subunit HslV